MTFTPRKVPIAAAMVILFGASPAPAQNRDIIVASTTSTEDSGLFGHILPLFKAKTGIEVRVVAQAFREPNISVATLRCRKQRTRGLI